jgi:hypothetical protein
LNAHPPGTPVTVRYDSADPTKSVMASDFMPRGGSHTADNIKLLAACFVSFIVLLALAATSLQNRIDFRIFSVGARTILLNGSAMVESRYPHGSSAQIEVTHEIVVLGSPRNFRRSLRVPGLRKFCW